MYPIQISSDELLDRSLILQLKANRMQNPEKRKRAQSQLDALRRIGAALEQRLETDLLLARLTQALYACHEQLWETEELLRQIEAAGGPFDETFIAAARSIYKLNDRRHEIRTQIAEHLGETGDVKEYLVKKDV